jgi:predicted porin
MGAGLKYKMGAFDMGVAMQNYEETGKDKRTELSLGVGYSPFKNMTVYVDMLNKDASKKAGDALEVGMKYKF